MARNKWGKKSGGGSGEGGIVIVAESYYDVESQYEDSYIPLISYEQGLDIVSKYLKGSNIVITDQNNIVSLPIVGYNEDNRTLFAQFSDIGVIGYIVDIEEEMVFPYIVEKGAMRIRKYVTSQSNFVLYPNEYAKIQYTPPVLNVTLESHHSLDTYIPYEYGYSQEYMLEFTTGKEAPQVNFPSNIKWANPLVIAPNSIYQVSILNGIALYTSVEA